MNAEFTDAFSKRTEFTVEVAEDGYPPHTTKISQRSTCGKWIYEHVLVFDYLDVQREVAIYSLLGTGKRPA